MQSALSFLFDALAPVRAQSFAFFVTAVFAAVLTALLSVTFWAELFAFVFAVVLDASADASALLAASCACARLYTVVYAARLAALWLTCITGRFQLLRYSPHAPP